MIKARYFFILLGILLILYIIFSIRRRKLLIDYSILWSLGALVIFIIGCFPGVIDWLAGLLGIRYPPSLLFLLANAFFLIISLNYSENISELKQENTNLVQSIALLEKRIRKLEKKDK